MCAINALEFRNLSNSSLEGRGKERLAASICFAVLKSLDTHSWSLYSGISCFLVVHQERTITQICCELPDFVLWYLVCILALNATDYATLADTVVFFDSVYDFRFSTM